MQLNEFLMQFLLFYPLIMSLVWFIGSLIYYFTYERRKSEKPNKEITDGISFLVSCFNEEDTVADTLKSIVQLSYPIKEVIFINDGSSDRTAEVLKDLQSTYEFAFIDLPENNGKANALNTAAKQAKYPYIMCVDSDTIIDDDAPYYMIENFINYENVGAVTGNPRIRNKHTLLGKIQIIEFASIIGTIKRTQQVNGFVNTVSGVFTLFSKEILEEVGYWDIDMITEDIALSWKLHLNGNRVIYEPRALCYMLVPETLRGLFKQRIRWAQGNQEVLLRDGLSVFKRKNISFFILFLEQIISVLWVVLMTLSFAIVLLRVNLLDFYFYQDSFNILLVSAFFLISMNIILFTFALLLDSRYEKGNLRYILYLSWYPTFYWLLNSLSIVIAIPRALKRKKGEFATWSSPDRGE